MSLSRVDDGFRRTDESKTKRLSWVDRLHHVGYTVFHHAAKHTGVGIVCSVAYFDPGNWGVDLQAGSQYGYKLLFVVLLSGLFAAFLQVLASRLGVVTGLDLASHCRLLFHDRPNHTRVWRWTVLYPLYVLSEIAIVSTDLAELLGSAIALVLLFPSLPLWAGVLLTASDVLLILALGNPLRGRPVRLFELVIAILVLAVLICMAIIIARIDVNWGQAFDGFVPSKAIFANGALYTSVGILGATVMPHSLFLGSHLATQDRIASEPLKKVSTFSSFEEELDGPVESRLTRTKHSLKSLWVSLFRVERSDDTRCSVNRHSDRENSSLAFVRAHLYHGMVDVVVSLLGFAVIINAMILILASAVFYYGTSGGHGSESPASLFDAHTLIKNIIGKPAALLFALALLASGQSASIVATVAGQSVSEGFLRWKVSPVIRRLLTRLLGLIPSMIVAIAVGPAGIDTLLVASQVVLSIVLPFITFPLIYLTSSKRIMSVRKSTALSTLNVPNPAAPPDVDPASNSNDIDIPVATVPAEDIEAVNASDMVDFSSGKFMTGVGYLIWIVIVVANVYVLVTLGMGEGG
ncbi:natural resistance-associated macrophage protein-domain-containing protein [Hygrophoropsis aurantiaca]|uniref:Natural resistance-associated macrophage protein-domain-containing protein n=1 Tax=Hygrophoropsis aurantiaca TaxID=72124 RepID=A0ACB8AQN0_9AGAM|nr:natural resistance-associated macrophage protein-domain-containing protein [Hygrophoropsis aurantiaca]